MQMMTYLSILIGRVVASLESNSERGAAGVEYGLLVALIAAVIVGTVATLGGQINTAFNTVVKAL
jgi:pilus assembly protein Flp/PilA